ncbi:MAG: hypothetical protein MR902_07180 [Campylobacter sp.]|nr:hypothetical protein [Campylobacter sp.]
MISILVKKSPKTILLKFDTTDNQISEETVLKFDESLSLKNGANVSDLYIVGADIIDGKMLALSKSFSTLIEINLSSKTITNAYKLPQIGDFSDIAIKGENLFVLLRVDGKDKVYVLNNPLY